MSACLRLCPGLSDNIWRAMGLFDLLKRRQPTDLRSELFTAIAKGDARDIARMCEQHEAEILERFPDWQTVPLEVREEPAAMQRYANGLIGVAVHFMSERGLPALMQRLQGGSSPEDNPAAAWGNTLQEAQHLKETLDFEAGIKLLSDLLIDVRDLAGTAVDHYLPQTLGLLGDLHFQAGSLESAIASTRQALDGCESAGDDEGVLAYLGNLYECHRFAGQGTEAATYAERLAALPGPDATWFQVQAKIVRNGEPLNRVVVKVDGRRMEVEEALPDGRLQFVFQRNRISLFASDVWSDRGISLGTESKFEEALGAFREAAKADIYNPDPHYKAGVTNLYLERYFDALEAYERTERLAPGWFHCRADAWLADEAAQGRLPHSVLLLILRLSEGSDNPKEALLQIQAAIVEVPHVPILDLLAATFHSALGNQKEAAAGLRAGLGKTADDDTRTRLLLDLAMAVEDAEEKQRLAEEAAALSGNLVAAATAKLVARAASPPRS